MDVYQKLQERLDTNAAGAPPTPSFDKILRILFSPEEAELANYLTWRLQPVSKLSDKTGMAPDKLTEMLETMADRGVIFAKLQAGSENRYSLLPTIPGLYEFPFMRPERNPHIDELRVLWEQYFADGLAASHAGSPTSQMRVIAVQETIPMVSEVTTYDAVSTMIDRAGAISLANCACRVCFQKCDKPLETCLSFDDTARFLVDRGMARFVDKEEALRVLKMCEEEGLVHMINNSDDKLSVICNCCGCCCNLLRGLIELNNPDAIAVSPFVVQYVPDDCIGCGLCVERCPVTAIKESDDLVAVDTEKCIGCGLCVSACPTESLTLHNRTLPPKVFATGKELVMTVLQEKGRLEGFTRISKE